MQNKKKKKSLLIHASHCLPSPVFSQFLVMMDISNMICFPFIFHIAFEYILLHIGVVVGIAACRCECTHTYTFVWMFVSGGAMKHSFLLVQQSTMTGTPITWLNHVISIISLHKSHTVPALLCIKHPDTFTNCNRYGYRYRYRYVP